jgi:hypothetical protein
MQLKVAAQDILRIRLGTTGLPALNMLIRALVTPRTSTFVAPLETDLSPSTRIVPFTAASLLCACHKRRISGGLAGLWIIHKAPAKLQAGTPLQALTNDVLDIGATPIGTLGFLQKPLQYCLKRVIQMRIGPFRQLLHKKTQLMNGGLVVHQVMQPHSVIMENFKNAQVAINRRRRRNLYRNTHWLLQAAAQQLIQLFRPEPHIALSHGDQLHDVLRFGNSRCNIAPRLIKHLENIFVEKTIQRTESPTIKPVV